MEAALDMGTVGSSCAEESNGGCSGGLSTEIEEERGRKGGMGGGGGRGVRVLGCGQVGVEWGSVLAWAAHGEE
jgi:hypothetical protein